MTPLRRALTLGLLGGLLAGLLQGCGGGGAGDDPLALGTVSLRNESDLGMAPLTVTQFFLVPVGEVAPGTNLLSQPAAPGAVVILGLFPAGTYNAVAVLSSGLNINFLDRTVVAGQPTTFVIPGN
ncbi:MAG: hypothetical protein P1V36_15950 [Planctomycetota bacterium]|nr:hypothetical protein [Planctomycetota bacterium]